MTTAAEIFADEGFIMQSGARHLGGHIGNNDERAEWIEEKIGDWKFAIDQLSMIAKKMPPSNRPMSA